MVFEEREDRRFTEHQCSYPFGVARSQEERGVSAVGVSDDVGGFQTKGGHEPCQIVRMEFG